MIKTKALIIGGGIVGAGVFRHLALNGIQTMLIDRGSFSSQTSAGSSKMLHGGIRYLEQFEFGLVHEALHEKNLWLKHAPKLTSSQKFLFPVFSDSRVGPLKLKMGMMLYDLLARGKNPPHEKINKKEIQKTYSHLDSKDLLCGFLYHDAIVDDKGLALETINRTTKQTKSTAKENIEFISFEKKDSNYMVTVFNHKEKKQELIECEYISFCTGPFTDLVLKKAYPNWKNIMAPSQGIHLWLDRDKLKIHGPVVLETPDERVLFVIPHKEKILVGTTDTPIEGEFYNLQANQNDINYLLDLLNEYFPSAKITSSDILSTTAAVRPLVAEDKENTSEISREHYFKEIEPGISLLTGGKYTTFRVMGEDVAKHACEYFGADFDSELFFGKW